MRLCPRISVQLYLEVDSVNK